MGQLENLVGQLPQWALRHWQNAILLVVSDILCITVDLRVLLLVENSKIILEECHRLTPP